MRPMSFQVLWSSYNFGLLPIERVIWGRNPVGGALWVDCDTVASSPVTPIDCSGQPERINHGAQ